MAKRRLTNKPVMQTCDFIDNAAPAGKRRFIEVVPVVKGGLHPVASERES